MVQINNNSKVTYILFFAILFHGCTNSFELRRNQLYLESKSDFDKPLILKDIFDFFPEQTSNKTQSFYAAGPGWRGENCTGAFFVVNAFDNKLFWDDFSKNYSFQHETQYVDSANFLINMFCFAKENEICEDINVYLDNKYPIPDLSRLQLSPNNPIKDSLVVDGALLYYTYEMPSDLKVFVLSAEKGFFFETDCNEERPETLQEWKHGYSKGVAVSLEVQVIVYWVIVW